MITIPKFAITNMCSSKMYVRWKHVKINTSFPIYTPEIPHGK